MITTRSQEILRSEAIADPYPTIIEIITAQITLRVTDDAEPITYLNEVYQPWPVRLIFGQRGADRQPSATVELGNVSQDVAALLRSVTVPPVCNIRVVRVQRGEYVTFEGEVVTFGGDPVTFGGPVDAYGVRAVEVELLGLRIVAVDFTAPTANCRLGPRWDWSRERCPPIRHDGRFVGLWS